MAEKYIAHSYGILYAQEGNSYYLLKDHPIDRYPWQLDCQQMWYVVKREWKAGENENYAEGIYYPVGYAHQLITSYPTVEFLSEEIEVETIGLDENEKEDELDLKYEMEGLEKDSAQELSVMYAEYQEEPLPF